jgi:hypothetical protein
MIGDVLIQTREVAGKWMATVAVHVANDSREGPEYQQVAVALEPTRSEATKTAVNEWLSSVR